MYLHVGVFPPDATANIGNPAPDEVFGFRSKKTVMGPDVNVGRLRHVPGDGLNRIVFNPF